MSLRSRAHCAVAIVLASMAVLSAVRADDSDIYYGGLLPQNSVPLVMFSLDTSSSAGATYGGCSVVGVGATMCAPAAYFRDNCPTCVLPLATAQFTRFHAMKYALRMVLLQMTGVKAGLMLNHNNNSNCAGPRPLLPSNQQRCSNGGYIARGFKLLDQVTVPGNTLLGIPATTGPGPNSTELLNIIDSLPVPGGPVSHPYQGKELFFEMFRYLTGQGIYNGHNGYTDYGTDNTLNLNQDNPAISWDSSIEGGPLYVSPLVAGLNCARIFTVNFELGPTSQDDDSDAAIASSLPGGMTGINLQPPNNKFADVIGYLQTVDLARSTSPFGTVPALTGIQNVTSYFITPATPLDSNPATFDQTMTSYAQRGGTTRPLSFSSDPSQLVGSLKSTLGQILSVSTTFVAASVPVNVFNRTQVLNDVYMALFQPDASARPFWNGNVKKLKTQVFAVPCPAGAPASCMPSEEVRLVDALGAVGVDTDGRISNNALTFWTDPSSIAANPTNGVTAGRDGRFVNLGGAGQKIPGYLSASPGNLNTDVGARQMFLYPGTGGSLVPLNADALTAGNFQTALGATSAAESLGLLKWIRGFDTYDLNGNGNTVEVRPWLMADPLHSRPLAINYGAPTGYSQGNPAIFVAVGTNDGLLHLFRNTTTAGVQTGAEQWAFLPFDLINIQKSLAVDNPVSVRQYGLDGSPVAYIKDVNGDGTVDASAGDKVYLYIGMRRGGRAYYALDITDPTTPHFLWRITPTAHATAANGDQPTADFAQLGYSFSQPRLARVQTGIVTTPGPTYGLPIVKTALIFGGGYDPVNDYTAATKTLIASGLPSTGSVNTDDTMGNAIFVVDAETGDLIWKAVGPVSGVLPAASGTVFPHAQLKDSIPSTMTVVDTNSDGITDRAVVGDTGGNVWRVDLGGSSPSSWKLTLLAKLGRAYASGKLDDRRFFHEADYVLSQDQLGPFDAIILGSGDRADPLDYGRVRSATGVETLTENDFFVLKDRRVGIGAGSDSNPLTPANLADVTSDCLQDLTVTNCNPDFTNGWRIRLTAGRGEKVLAAALTAANRIYFTSYLPAGSNSATSCGPQEGGGLLYAVNLKTGTAVFNYNTADGGTDAAPNTASDRSKALASSGIPTEVVYVNVPDTSGNEVKCALTSDLSCRALPGATRFRTFWYRDE